MIDANKIINDLLDQLEERLNKVVEVVEGDLATVRTGRAKPDLISGLSVLAYGQRMKLFELATVSAPDTGLLVISPWDKSVIADIEKAIMASDLQLSPNVSGDVIKIAIPSLTEERRLDFVKLVHQKIESGKVMVRQVRQEIKEKIDDLKGSSGISEDDTDRMLEQLQRKIDEFGLKIEALGKDKEAEIMAV